MNSVICFGMWDDTKIKRYEIFWWIRTNSDQFNNYTTATDWDKVAFLENLLNKAFWTLFELNNCIDQKLLFENHIKVPQNHLNQGQWDFVSWPFKGKHPLLYCLFTFWENIWFNSSPNRRVTAGTLK